MKPIRRFTASLPEVHSSVHTARPTVLRRMLAFAGPAYLVSVGYMDPGNWATDLVGGVALRLPAAVGGGAVEPDGDSAADAGGATGHRGRAGSGAGVPRGVSEDGVQRALWVLCEIAIAACDLAEVLGAAIGLKLLFHLPLLDGSAADRAGYDPGAVAFALSGSG